MEAMAKRVKGKLREGVGMPWEVEDNEGEGDGYGGVGMCGCECVLFYLNKKLTNTT